jgi:monoamine oxidase
MAVQTLEEIKREPLSGINVVVVGGGLGGLFAAIELWRQGHNVRILEGKEGVEGLGRFCSITSTSRKFKGH